jgi:hypothetical protein
MIIVPKDREEKGGELASKQGTKVDVWSSCPPVLMSDSVRPVVLSRFALSVDKNGLDAIKL